MRSPRKTQEERLTIRKPGEIAPETAIIFAAHELAVCAAYGLTIEEISSGKGTALVSTARALTADLLRGKCSNWQRALVWQVSPAAVVYSQRQPSNEPRLFETARKQALRYLAELQGALAADLSGEKLTRAQKTSVAAVKERAAQISEIIDAARRGSVAESL